MRISAEWLAKDAQLQAYIDKQRARWEAADIAAGHPPSKTQRQNRELWEIMVEAECWDQCSRK